MPIRLVLVAMGQSVIRRRGRGGALVAGGAFVVLCLATLSGAAPPAADAQSVGRYAYRLADNWRQRPWSLQAGHFGYAADISTAADGTVYVLDRQHVVVHVLSANHLPLGVWPLPYQAPGAGWTPEKLDLGFDGSLLVLAGETGKRGGLSRVDRLTPAGRLIATVELDVDYNDVAGLPDGGFALSRSYPLIQPTPEPRTAPSPEKGGVDLFDPAGRRVVTLDDRPLFYAVAVDVASDGTLLTLVRIPNPSTDLPPPFPPTPEPAVQSPASGDPPLTPLEGVAVYAADHHYVATWYINNAEDVAVGPAVSPGPRVEGLASTFAAFVSRHMEVFRVGDLEPVYSGPAGQLTSPFYGGAPLHLDVDAIGRLRASIAGCYHQGVMDFGRPLGRVLAARLFGALDRPHLGGPAFPLRVDAGPPPVAIAPAVPGGVGGALADEGVDVLQGRFAREDDVLGVTHFVGRPDADFDQSVQRWSTDGRLESEMGVCGGTAASWSPEHSDMWWVRDVARDGADLYTVDAYLVRFRPDNGFPGWTYWPAAAAADGEGSRLTAVSADDGQAAVLDSGADEVIVLGRNGQIVSRWPIAAGGNHLAVDLALRDGRVYLADGGTSRVLVYDINGRLQDAWPLHDGPVAIDVGAGGEVAVLGRSGWAFRYTTDGWQEAAWAMPPSDARPLDIAVGAGGRIFIPYHQKVWQQVGVRDEMIYEIVDAGLWVFDPTAIPPAPAPSAGACWAVPDKSVAPASVRLGNSVGVQLAVHGACPGHRDPLSLVVLFDTSRSMNWDGALARGQDVALNLLALLDPATDEAALITFSDVPKAAPGFTRDFAGLARAVAGVEAVGDTRIAGALALARSLLEGASPNGRRAVVIISDADFHDDALSAAAPLKAGGFEIFVFVVATPRFDSGSQNYMAALTGDRARVLVNPDRFDVRQGLDLARHFANEPRLFHTITITDVVPDNMTYMTDSAVPPADFRPNGRGGGELVWTLGAVAATQGLKLAYRLTPTEVGRWPTNIEAAGLYRDAAGAAGRIVFPIPVVDVWDLAGLHYHAYLPAAAKGVCQARTQPLDVVLVIDASDSMAEVDASGRVKLDAARQAANEFSQLLELSRDRVAVVDFNSAARIQTPLTSNPADLRRALDQIRTSPGTRIDLGLMGADAVLTQSPRAAADAAVILLTDGLQSGSTDAVVSAAAGVRRQARLVAVGLGTDIDRELLRAIVSAPFGYYESPDAGKLAEIYRELSATLACPFD